MKLINDVNYAASCCILDTKINHPNADKLQGWLVKGTTIWTNLSYKEGEEVIYFPVGCVINKHLLSWMNLFRDKTLNSHPDKSGFFDIKGRVKALKLRGEPT